MSGGRHARFRLLVFDLDGTLVDSLRDLAEAANDLLIECGREPLSHDGIGRMVGDGAATLVARVFAASGGPQPVDALSRFLALYNGRLLRWTRPYPGIPEALETLSRRTTLAVLTNKPLAPTRQILEGLELSRYFEPERVVGGDGPFPRKPDPAGLLHLAASAGVSASETVLIGDSAIDWQTAQAARTGVRVVRYGFGFQRLPVAADEHLVDAPRDLLQSL
jgi:phosphoglycolate phosphatase